MKPLKIEVFKSKGGWMWHIVGGNGKILAHSEIYKRRQGAVNTAGMVFERMGARGAEFIIKK